MMREATTVVVRRPLPNGNFATTVYKVGEKAPVPMELDNREVERISISDDGGSAHISLRDYGEVMITDYIVQIMFENPEYKKIRDAEKRDTEGQEG